jgi:hypothetical protein
MQKIFFVIIMSFLLSQMKVCGQKSSDLYLEGCGEQGYAAFFDSVHNLRKDFIKDLNHSYYCYVVFNIDSSSSSYDFQLIEHPDARLPDAVKKYIRELFELTNGKWQIRAWTQGNSSPRSLAFLVSLLKSDQPINERLKDDIAFELSLIAPKKQKNINANGPNINPVSLLF